MSKSWLHPKQGCQQLDSSAGTEESPEDGTLPLSSTEFAARKLLEAVTADFQQEDFWTEATDPGRGLKFRVDNDTIWYRFRNKHFRGKRKRIAEDNHRYGDREELNKYSQASKWKELLELLVQNYLAKATEDLRGVVLVNDARGAGFLHRLQLLTSCSQKILGLEQTAS